jgi:hypothetical protein
MVDGGWFTGKAQAKDCFTTAGPAEASNINLGYISVALDI